MGENPLLRCKNCGESGHWARECPNETKRAACILCGKDTHDSFTCSEKICFKCNKAGHMAINCQETHVIKCNRCGLNGHKEIRCLKIWKSDFTETQLKLLRCMECGKTGHLKCTKEKVSVSIPIDTYVRDDLEEFISSKHQVHYEDEEDSSDGAHFSFDYIEDGAKKSEPAPKSIAWVKSNTNLKVPDKTYSHVYRHAQKSFGIPKNHNPKDAYCCFCGGRHSEALCAR